MEQQSPDNLPPGKLRVSGVGRGSSRVSSGSDPTEGWSCLLTLLDPADDGWIRRKYGVIGLRRHKLLRVTAEAYEQEGSLSQEVVAFDILGCGIRTLQRDLVLFSQLGVWVPFQRYSERNRLDRYLYKAAAVRHYLEGKSKHEIAELLYQRLEFVESLIVVFAKLTKLCASGIGKEHLPRVLDLPAATLEEYLALYRQFNTPARFKMLDVLAKAAL
ncbi:MAG: DUF1670 domain-containing protein [Acidobacteriota bacterium]